MCDLSTEERSEVWSQTWRRARKQHRCAGCGRTIATGKRYCVTFTAFEGYGSSEKSCRACTALAERFGAEHDITPLASSLLEYLDECVREEDPGKAEKWARAAARMRRRLAAPRVTP